MLTFAGAAYGQISSRPVNVDSEYLNSVSAGLSLGSTYNTDADFWGWSVDYSRTIAERWSTTISLAFDQETDRPDDKPKKVVDSYSLVWSASYALNQTFSLSSGLSRGIANDDNADGDMKFRSGDWGTGIALGVSLPDFPSHDRMSSYLGCAWEWNISQSEPGVSCDVGMAFGF